MRGTVLLAWRYLMYFKLRTAILAVCVALVVFLPVSVEFLVQHYQDRLSARARTTPLVVGAKGSRLDLLMHSLYFKGQLRETTTLARAEAIAAPEASGDVEPPVAIPLYYRYSARGYPIIGTTPEYYELRALRPLRGSTPLIWGDVALGANVARELGLGPGGRLLSDAETTVGLTTSYPLRMQVTGVFAATGTADDDAVFVDLHTAWIIGGLGHGHQDVDPAENPDLVLDSSERHVTTNAAVFEYNEITEKNIDTFHFHGGAELLPVSAIIVAPRSEKSRTILTARLRNSEEVQLLVPTQGLRELFDVVFRVKRFFDANLVLVATSTFLLLVLVILLSVRVRQREIETLRKIGCSRRRIVLIQLTELTLMVTIGLALGGLSAWSAFVWVVDRGLVF